jgi:3-oxoadipate enol-lactonase
MRFLFGADDMHAVTLGSASPNRPALLFLHGLACPAGMWRNQLVAFQHSHHCVALDFPAHGGSETPNDPTMYSELAFAALAVALLDALKIPRAVVVGLSMGGGVALTMALQHPTRVAGLLVADAGSGSDHAEAGWAMQRQAAEALRKDGLRAYAERMADGPVVGSYARQGPAARKELLALLEGNDGEGVARVIEGVQAVRAPMQQRPLRLIGVPTTVLVGEHDIGCLKASHHAAATIPGAELVVVPGAGHMTALEAPEAFNDALRDLLARVGSG